MLVLGLGTWALEAATAVPYFAAIAAMTSSVVSVPQWITALVGYATVMMAPGVAIALVWTLLGERLRPRLERWLDTLRASSGTAVGWIVGIVGFFVLQDAGWRLAIIYELLSDSSLRGP